MEVWNRLVISSKFIIYLFLRKRIYVIEIKIRDVTGEGWQRRNEGKGVVVRMVAVVIGGLGEEIGRRGVLMKWRWLLWRQWRRRLVVVRSVRKKRGKI